MTLNFYKNFGKNHEKYQKIQKSNAKIKKKHKI